MINPEDCKHERVDREVRDLPGNFNLIVERCIDCSNVSQTEKQKVFDNSRSGLRMSVIEKEKRNNDNDS